MGGALRTILGGFTAGGIGAGVWSLAYGISGGQALLVIVGLHATLGLSMAGLLIASGRGCWRTALSGALMLGLVAPLVITVSQ